MSAAGAGSPAESTVAIAAVGPRSEQSWCARARMRMRVRVRVGGWLDALRVQLKNAHLVRNKRLLRGGSGSVRSWRQFPGRVAAREACPQGPHQNLPRFMKTVIKVRGASSVPEQGRAQYRKQRFFPIERNRLHELDTPPLAPTHLRSKRNGGCCNGRSSPTPLNPTSEFRPPGLPPKKSGCFGHKTLDTEIPFL